MDGKINGASGPPCSCGTDSALGGGLRLHHCSYGSCFAGSDVVAGVLASLLQISPDGGTKHVRHVPDFDVTHLLARALEDSLGIRQIRSYQKWRLKRELGFSLAERNKLAYTPPR